MKLLTERIIKKLFKQAVATWFDEDITLKEHVTMVFAQAGYPISIRISPNDANDEDEVFYGIKNNLAMAA